MLDVTTVCITSEFGRTMRRVGFPISSTGTDHNTVSNTILLAGKKIKGNIVLGETDFRSANEKLSPLHLKLDQTKIKVMGKPFNFSLQASHEQMADEYFSKNFLTMTSVLNTLLATKGMDKKKALQAVYGWRQRGSPGTY